jgi:Tfp pilus assembly protein PilV
MIQLTRISQATGAGPRGRHGGFALIEALISLLVVAFGMLAIGAFHFTLSRAADVAKQRTEATRIAQSEIDRARSFVSRGSDGTPGDWRLTYTEDLAVGTFNLADIADPRMNTTFRRQVVISRHCPFPRVVKAIVGSTSPCFGPIAPELTSRSP